MILILFSNGSNNVSNYKIVMIRRKDTIGYVEFLRGKFSIQKDDYIIKLFDMMTKTRKREY